MRHTVFRVAVAILYSMLSPAPSVLLGCVDHPSTNPVAHSSITFMTADELLTLWRAEFREPPDVLDADGTLVNVETTIKWFELRRDLLNRLVEVAPERPEAIEMLFEEIPATGLIDTRAEASRIELSRWLPTIEKIMASKSLSEIKQTKSGMRLYYLQTIGRILFAADSRGSIEAQVSEFAKTFPKSDEAASALAFMADELQNVEPDVREKIRQQVIDEFGGSPAAKRLQSEQFRKKMIGKPLPLRFDDVFTAKPVNVEDYRGKLVVVYFWSSSTAYSFKQIPQIMALRAKYSRDGVVFMGIIVDAPSEFESSLWARGKSVKDTLEEFKIVGPQWFDADNRARKKYDEFQFDGFSTLLVVDKTGALSAFVELERIENELRIQLER